MKGQVGFMQREYLVVWGCLFVAGMCVGLKCVFERECVLWREFVLGWCGAGVCFEVGVFAEVCMML